MITTRARTSTLASTYRIASGTNLASTYRIMPGTELAGLGIAKTAGGLKYRDWSFPDGYTYRQYEGGSRDVTILKSPRSTTTTTLSRDVPSQRAAWEAIDRQIRMAKAGRTADDIRIAGALVTIALQAVTPKAPKRRHRAPVVEVEAPPEEPKPFPWVWIAVAAAGAILIAGRS